MTSRRQQHRHQHQHEGKRTAERVMGRSPVMENYLTKNSVQSGNSIVKYFLMNGHW